MQLKLTRNIGRDDLKALGLVKEDKEIAAALAKYSEGSVHDFEKETGEVLVKRGLAEDDDGVPGPNPPQPKTVRGVSPAPPIAKAENFRDNPHEPGQKKDK